MSRRIARLTVVCLSLILFTAATEAAGVRGTAPDRDRPALVQEMPSFGEIIRDWIAWRVARLKCSMGIDPNGQPCAVTATDGRVAPLPGDREEGVQLKCSAGIDPDGRPCAMPAAGCRCEP